LAAGALRAGFFAVGLAFVVFFTVAGFLAGFFAAADAALAGLADSEADADFLRGADVTFPVFFGPAEAAAAVLRAAAEGDFAAFFAAVLAGFFAAPPVRLAGAAFLVLGGFLSSPLSAAMGGTLAAESTPVLTAAP
jgi:hypothetical protein